MEVNNADRDAIRSNAYYKWLEAGAPQSDGVEFWLAAEWEYLHTLDEDRRLQQTQSQSDGQERSRAWGRQAEEFEFETSRDQHLPAAAARNAARDKDNIIGARG